MKKIYLLVLFIVVLSSFTYAETIKDSYTSCEDNICTYTSNRRFIKENNQWKQLEKAQSLKNIYNYVYEELDGRYGITITDFNYTTVELCLSSNVLNIGVPIQIFKEEKVCINEDKKTNECLEFEIQKDIKYEGTSFFSNLMDKCYTIKLNEKILDYKIKFGSNSTTIYLDEPENDLLEDTYIAEDEPTANKDTSQDLSLHGETGNVEHILLKFNNSLSGTETILDASLNMYALSNGLDADTEGYNGSVHYIFMNYTWNETGVVYNTRPTIGTEYTTEHYGSVYFFGGVGEPVGWISWNITDLIQTYINDDNFSLYVFGHDHFGSPFSSDNVPFAKKESGSNTPQINITYEIIGVEDTIPPIWDQYPDNVSLYNTTALYIDFNATDETAISSYGVNDTTNFKIGSNGILENNTILPFGNHSLFINVSDTSGNENSTVFNIEVLGLAACVENITYTDWTSYVNITGCLINDTYQQERNRTLYDSEECGYTSNSTEYSYNWPSCNYCSYNATYTDWTEWINISCLPSSTMNESRERTQYDSSSNWCYQITNIATDLWNSGTNITTYEYRNETNCTYTTTNTTQTIIYIPVTIIRKWF